MKRIGRSPYNSGKETDRTFFSFERESRKGIEKLRNSNTLSSSVEDINKRIDDRVYAEKKKKIVKKYSIGARIAVGVSVLVAATLLAGYLLGIF